MTKLSTILSAWRGKRARERTYQFWTAQCHEALARMRAAKSDAEYEQWNATMRVNMRRYEQEVLER